MLNVNVLKLTVRNFYMLQDLRIVTDNQAFGLGRDTNATQEEIDWFMEVTGKRHAKTEKELGKDIEKIIVELPLWQQWLQYVWGIGPILTGGLVGEIKEIGRFDTISKLWSYAGQETIAVVKDGNITRRWFPSKEEAELFVNHAVGLEQKSAEHWAAKDKKKSSYDSVKKAEDYLKKCTWGIHHEYETIASRRITGLPDNTNSRLKVIVWKCGQSFQKGNAGKSKYRAYCDTAKKFYLDRDTVGESYKKGMQKLYKMPNGREITAKQINDRALRKTVKLFLSHLWVQWRKIEGLSISKPYVIEKMGHQDYIEPFYDKEPIDE